MLSKVQKLEEALRMVSPAVGRCSLRETRQRQQTTPDQQFGREERRVRFAGEDLNARVGEKKSVSVESALGNTIDKARRQRGGTEGGVGSG